MCVRAARACVCARVCVCVRVCVCMPVSAVLLTHFSPPAVIRATMFIAEAKSILENDLSDQFKFGLGEAVRIRCEVDSYPYPEQVLVQIGGKNVEDSDPRWRAETDILSPNEDYKVTVDVNIFNVTGNIIIVRSNSIIVYPTSAYFLYMHVFLCVVYLLVIVVSSRYAIKASCFLVKNTKSLEVVC